LAPGEKGGGKTGTRDEMREREETGKDNAHSGPSTTGLNTG
jgi:hypothetical protein